MGKIKRIAIANRGEVAYRIHRTCQRLGYETVLLHSKPDVQTKAYRACDYTYCIGPGAVTESYLNGENLIHGALEMKCTAIHPGFGFLSESSEFAKKVIDSGVLFIGPSPETIAHFGDKKKAKSLCESLSIPVISGENSSKVSTLIKKTDEIGFPVLVKASAGGGGRGMRVIRNSNEAQKLIESAMNEALKAFGNSDVFLEKYLDCAKHIEVQIFGDRNGKIHILGERECSIQRKHQKIIEESPSPSLTKEQRNLVYSYAQRIGEAGNYKNAGTVEFLLQNNKFYFLEVNTRLQVEHPVTEEVFGIDLVEAQIKTTFDEGVSFPQTPQPHKHSVELRLYAENPYENGTPSTGTCGHFNFPEKKGRRYELGFEKGDQITSYYDSMIAKIISTQSCRKECLTDLIQILKTSHVFGLYTNAPLLAKILNHPEFISGEMTTQFFENHFSKPLEPLLASETVDSISEQLIKIFHTPSKFFKQSPWNQNWREPLLYKSLTLPPHIYFEIVDKNLWWTKDVDTYKRPLSSASSHSSKNQQEDHLVRSPMPGIIYKLLCKKGDKIKKGQTLFIIEAMKMEYSLVAKSSGQIKSIYFKEGSQVKSNDLIVELKTFKNQGL